jgi:hypothetical protein
MAAPDPVCTPQISVLQPTPMLLVQSAAAEELRLVESELISRYFGPGGVSPAANVSALSSRHAGFSADRIPSHSPPRCALQALGAVPQGADDVACRISCALQVQAVN